ncbi:tetratricopeptide repeat protein [Meiothermus sp. CFH 77666]|uniref:tetratricopeptide repeat protein n=1 Tax=Meiothermus sp. CFH 77666 TaxID=2817942 RepID=UPI001AA02573|nr:tetratricopeptide repeat protein [Meiothermus sp. CFH 77666]MBO1437979.1 tetratricopeptide repeat protein [Meiothermus sp. CFH 77666]
MLRTLGGLHLEGETFSRIKPLLLVAYLAIEGSQPRRRLAEMFWPEAQDPLNNLSVALSQLRPFRVIEGEEALRAVIPTDLEPLHRALCEGRLSEVRGLYRGAFLEGVEAPLGEELEEWVWSTRERIALEVYRGYAAQARACFALGFTERGQALLSEALGLNGVRHALEVHTPPSPCPEPLPREVRKAYWAYALLPGRAAEVLSLNPEALERLYEERLLDGTGQARPLEGLTPGTSVGLPIEAQEVALTLARRLPLRGALPLYQIGRALWSAEDQERAGQALLAEARRMLSENPAESLRLLQGLALEPQVQLLRARALERLGRYQEALEALEESGLQGAEAAAVRGNLLFRLGQPGAEAQIQEALQGSSWAQGEALNLQGLLAFSRGEFGSAADLFARAAVRFLAAAETARQVDALNNRAVALFEQGSPEAEAVLGEALKAAGDVPLLQARALLNLGVVRERQGRSEEAQQLYRQSLEAAQKAGALEAEGRAWNNLGALFHRRGKPEEAEAAYRKALALAREGREWMLTAAVLANLAELRSDPASLEEAIALLQEARYAVLAERYRGRLEAFRPR